MIRHVAQIAATWAIVAACTACNSASAQTPSSSPVKKIVTMDPIRDVTIALPNTLNNPSYDFGPNLLCSLGNQMIQSGRYILNEPESAVGCTSPAAMAQAVPASVASGAPDQWDGSTVISSGSVKFYVDALSMRTGGRGDQMYYGFDERFRTPFNDGYNTQAEEFPLSPVQFVPSWFDRAYDDKGGAPLDTQSGLDLGQEFSLNALVAWVDVKYASYHSVIRVRAELDAPLANRHEIKSIQVTGSGYFYDVVGGYEMYSGGIGLARRDAMTAAFNNAFAGSFSVIDNWVKDLPLTAIIFQVLPTGSIYLNTGANSNVPVGTKYQATANPSLVFEVTESVPSGSIAKLDSGNLASVQTSMVLVEQKTAQASNANAQSAELAQATGSPLQPTPVAAESVSLPQTNLPKSNFVSVNVQENWTQAVLNSIVGAPFLPYRIWRYFQYDQDYSGSAPSAVAVRDNLEPSYAGASLLSNDSQQSGLPQGAMNWAGQMKSQPWAKQIGLDVANPMAGAGPIVAIIDSGVDYNHGALSDSIWKNPAPYTDPDGNTDLYGWDFISGDPRPFDDAYRGTEMASVVLGVAPLVQIMPLKIFNPFGVTSSAALYGAFQYAVDHGAKIIVCGWATRLHTQTIEIAIRYAKDHGVLVVAAAGDLGDDLSKVPAYPASLSKSYDNVLTVTGVDTTDTLVKVNSFNANFDPGTVGIAAPGQSILSAQPRNHTSQETTTGLAAAMVAGAIARNIALNGSGTYVDWILAVKAQSQAVPALATAVQGGLRLFVK